MRKMRCFVLILAIVLCVFAQVEAQTILYNGAGDVTAQGWLGYGQFPPPFAGPPAIPTAYTGTNSLNTNLQALQPLIPTPTTGYAGFPNQLYANPPGALVPVNGAFPVLDRVTGYSIDFNLTITSETRVALHRAGFSITVISSDGQGIELGFTSVPVNRIFAQDANFVEAEGAIFDHSVNTNYTLSVLGNSYTLTANGMDILTGNLRAYNFNPATSQPPLPFNPYTSPNFLFLGDNTDQANVNFTLGQVAVTLGSSAAAIPTVGEWGIIILAVLLLIGGTVAIRQRRLRRVAV